MGDGLLLLQVGLIAGVYEHMLIALHHFLTDLNDFNNTVQTITFRADEDGNFSVM